MKNDQAFNLELREIIKAIRSRYYIVLIIVVPALLWSIYYSKYNIKPYYHVETRLIVGNSIDSQGNSFNIADVDKYQKFISTYVAMLKTDLVIEKTTSKLKFKVSPELIKSNVTATSEADTQFMDIQLLWGNSKEAVDILNVLSETFIEEVKSIYPTCNLKIMDRVKDPQIIMPSKNKYIILGPSVGLIISILVIFVLEFMDDTLKTEEDIKEHLDIPILGLIPKERKSFDKINSECIDNLDNSVIEAYRSLRTNIDFTSVYKNVKSILVTSTCPAEGKTTTSSMLAVLMALAGKKTLLIDCDLRKPNIHNMFNLSKMIGLSNVLMEETRLNEAINSSEIENLYVLTAGNSAPNPSEILSSDRMKELLQKLKSEFQYVILDSPPVGLVTDAQILAQYTDGCLFVLSSGKSKIKEAIKAKELIEYVNGRILGVSINKLKDKTIYQKYGLHYGKRLKKDLKYEVVDMSNKKKEKNIEYEDRLFKIK